MSKTGIVGYGAFVPKYRIKVEEIARVWGQDAEKIKNGILVEEKSVPSVDEDVITMSVLATRNALKYSGVDPGKIGAIYVGSESHPYAVKSSAATVGDAVLANPFRTSADLEFACKAGTAGMQMCMGLVASGMIEYGVAVGADTSQGRPGDALEFTAAAGAASFIIGKKDPVAEIVDTCSYTTDTPDFWRREGEEYPSHGGRFTGEPGYFKHVRTATQKILEKTGHKTSDFDYVVFHQPNGKFPLRVAKMLGIPKEKLSQGLLVTKIGNTYSGATPLGLASVLDVAEPGELILATSYGSGAGADSFVLKVTKKILEKRGKAPTVRHYVEKKKYLTYGEYVKERKKIKR